ncbi:MAG: 5'/3'-nucleotidase SurE [Pseudomonadota bacterium]
MRILLSNDDGIQSEGFSVLERVARALSEDVWVCAPSSEQSGAGHSLTLHRPLRLEQVGDKRFTCDGTPTDCVLLAMHHVMKDNPPDLLLSGVNHGCNIAEDVTYSGTIAAAMEGTLLGVRSLALSQHYRSGQPLDFGPATQWAGQVVNKAIAVGWAPDVLLNINFPAYETNQVKGVKVVSQWPSKAGDHLEERIDPRGRSYFWIGHSHSSSGAPEDTDLVALRDGFVTVTPIHMDMTHYDLLDPLRAALA